MDDNTKQAEMDPWAKMGNMSTTNPSETSPEAEARATEWANSMKNAPKFNSDQDSSLPTRDENIADASAILNYGLNAASRETSVEQVMDTINNFTPKEGQDPINQLMNELGIHGKKGIEDLVDESKASKPNEEAYRQDVNAPSTIQKSYNGALEAIKEVKNLVSEVKTSPAYANLRAEAMTAGKGVFEYAVSKYDVRDLTVLFSALADEKREYEKEAREKIPEEEPVKEESAEENSPENPTL